MSDDAPTTRQRRLAAELRKLRESAGHTQAQAAQLLGWNDRTKLVRLESARQVPTVEEVKHILDHYGPADEAIRLALVQLARDVHRRGWWVSYGDVLPGSYVELEDAASRIRIFQVQLVPGLLQTPAYTRELTAAEISDADEVERRVQARATRRTLLDRSDAPQLDVILTEEVLRRPVGGRPVMRQQLASLLRDLERPNVSVQVVPTERGIYPAIGQGSLVLFQFAGPLDLDVAYLETIGGGMYLETIAQVQRATVTYDRIADAALSVDESAALIADVLKEMQQ